MIEIIMMFKDNKTMLLIYSLAFIVAVLIAMCFHEYAHAKMAYNCGDDTAYLAGRMTLNPVAHISPLGALAFLLVGFGWATPVPVNPVKFKDYRKGIFLTGIAGVMANFIICFFSAGLSVLFSYFLTLMVESNFWYYLLYFFMVMFSLSASINLSLCIFNLLPVSPLDGFNVLQSATKGTSKFVNFLKRYSQIILIVILISTVFERLMSLVVMNILVPINAFWYNVIFGAIVWILMRWWKT